MSKPELVTVTLPVPGNPFGTDFYILATLEIESWGTPETGRGYMADPANYDPGAGPEWSCKSAVLFHDCGGDGDPVLALDNLLSALAEFVESDAMRPAVEEALTKEKDGATEYALHCMDEAFDRAWRERKVEA